MAILNESICIYHILAEHIRSESATWDPRRLVHQVQVPFTERIADVGRKDD